MKEHISETIHFGHPPKGDCSENLFAQLKTLFRRGGEGGGNRHLLTDGRWKLVTTSRYSIKTILWYKKGWLQTKNIFGHNKCLQPNVGAARCRGGAGAGLGSIATP